MKSGLYNEHCSCMSSQLGIPLPCWCIPHNIYSSYCAQMHFLKKDLCFIYLTLSPLNCYLFDSFGSLKRNELFSCWLPQKSHWSLMSISTLELQCPNDSLRKTNSDSRGLIYNIPKEPIPSACRVGLWWKDGEIVSLHVLPKGSENAVAVAFPEHRFATKLVLKSSTEPSIYLRDTASTSHHVGQPVHFSCVLSIDCVQTNLHCAR